MNKKDKTFYDWDYVVKAASYFGGLKNINITGGEPSVHPNFTEFSRKLKDLFKCEVLSVWTNGTNFKSKFEAWKYYDVIHITNYTEATFEGSPNNTESIKWIKEQLPDKKIYAAETTHTPLTNRGSKMCFRGYSDTVEFVDGYIYPCSSSSGLKTKVRIPLSEDWKEKILTIHPPCGECLFAEA